MSDSTRLSEILSTFVGQPCWSAIAGDADDYALVLDLGEKHRRSLRLANPDLSFLQRTYEGSHSLLVECPWRIDGPDRVAATCFDARREEGRGALDALDQIGKRAVVAVRARAPGYDLAIDFEDGWALRTLAIEVDDRSGRNNWQCWTPRGSATVRPGSELVFATREDAENALTRLRLAPFEGFDEGDDDE